MGLPNFPVSGTPLPPSLGQECHARHPTQHTNAQPGYRGVWGAGWLRACPGSPPPRGPQPASLDGANACVFPSSWSTGAAPGQRAPGEPAPRGCSGRGGGPGGPQAPLLGALGAIAVLPLILGAMRKMLPFSPVVSRLSRGRAWAQHVAGCVPGVLRGSCPSYCCFLRGCRRRACDGVQGSPLPLCIGLCWLKP